MKVVCIEDVTDNVELGTPKIFKGNIYHVIDETTVKNYKLSNNQIAEDGLYYKLIEVSAWYHSSLFVKINEDEALDEMELVNNKQETV